MTMHALIPGFLLGKVAPRGAGTAPRGPAWRQALPFEPDAVINRTTLINTSEKLELTIALSPKS